VKLLAAYYKEDIAKASLSTFANTLTFARTSNGHPVQLHEAAREALLTTRPIPSPDSECFENKKFELLAHRESKNRRLDPELSTHIVLIASEDRMDFDSVSFRSESFQFPSWHFEARDANQEAFLIAMEHADNPNFMGWHNIRARYVGEQVEFCVEKSEGSKWPFVWVLVMKVKCENKSWGEDVLASGASQEQKARTLTQLALDTAEKRAGLP
jgi:hypothetical protein